MNRYTIGILGIVALIAAQKQFNGDSKLVFFLLIAWVCIVLASDKQKG